MVEGQLFDLGAAEAVGTAIAHVGHQRPGGQQHQRRGGRAHAAKVETGLPPAVDLVVGVEDGRENGLGRRLVQPLPIDQGDGVGGHLAGQLAGRMGPHAVGHHEEVAPLLEIGLASGQDRRVGVLVVGAPKAHVAQRGVFQAMVPGGGGCVHYRGIKPHCPLALRRGSAV